MTQQPAAAVLYGAMFGIGQTRVMPASSWAECDCVGLQSPDLEPQKHGNSAAVKEPLGMSITCKRNTAPFFSLQRGACTTFLFACVMCISC
jgi:hypothetical protein